MRRRQSFFVAIYDKTTKRPGCRSCFQTTNETLRKKLSQEVTMLLTFELHASCTLPNIYRCAFCRATIPPGYMELPVLVPEQHHYRPKSNVDSKFVWYYEGRNGWWQFEERHSDEIEEALHRGEAE